MEPLTIDAKDAITRIQNIQREYEIARMRAILFVAYDREITAEDGETVLVDSDPYDWTDREVEQTFEADDGRIGAFVFESGDWLKGEDYETLDGVDGATEALGRALDVLQILAHGGTPAQGEECDHSEHIVGPDGTCPECGERVSA